MSPATPGGRSTPAGGGRVRGGRARTRRLLSVHERPVPRGYIVVDATESRPLVGSHSRRRLCVMEAPAERRCFKVQGPDRHVPAQTLAHRWPIFFFPISRRTQVSSAGHRTQGDPAGGKSRWVNFHEPPIKNIDEKSPRPTFGFKLDRDFDETRDLRFVCQPRKTRRDWLIGSLGYRLFP